MTSQFAVKSSESSAQVWRWMVAAVFAVAASLPIQAQQGGSLADAARQARAQKQATPQAAGNQAQQVADQLSEEQNDGGAPGGFKTYNAGEYKVFVPAPYNVDGHDEGGMVLSGPSVGSKRTVVMVGTPLVFQWGTSDTAFHDAAAQFVGLYQASSVCAKTKVANHDAYQCGLAGANLMGHRVSGNAVFVRVSGRIYPVFCAAPTDSHERDILNSPRSNYEDKLYAREGLDREEQDVRNVWQKCDTVFQSINVKENPGGQQATIATEMAPPTGTGPAASAGGPASLADIARQAKQGPGQAATIPPPPTVSAAPETTVPAGFKAYPFQYCNGPRQCWNASVLVPVDAQLVSSDCKQFIFETKVQGSPLLLMAGSTGSDCGANGPDLVRWHQLVDPENKRAPGTYSTISSQTIKLDGKPAAIITLGFRKGLTEWMGKRAEVETNGTQVVVGCTAARDHFADGDAVCSTVIGSLQLP